MNAHHMSMGRDKLAEVLKSLEEAVRISQRQLSNARSELRRVGSELKCRTTIDGGEGDHE